MKKRYYFIAGYFLVMLIIGLPAMSQLRISKIDEQLSPVSETLLMIACGMAVFLLLALLVWRIVKFIRVKLGRQPDDYFVMRIDAKKSIDHWLLTTNGKYDKKNDKAELERGKRDNQTVEW